MGANFGACLEIRRSRIELARRQHVPHPLLVGDDIAGARPGQALGFQGGWKEAVKFSAFGQHLRALPGEHLDLHGVIHPLEHTVHDTHRHPVKTLVGHIGAIRCLIVRSQFDRRCIGSSGNDGRPAPQKRNNNVQTRLASHYRVHDYISMFKFPVLPHRRVTHLCERA